ncbi:hypothetical protein PHYPSEUDO_013688 [Phytophthora pseudosyringae]|uniref:Uncharacterized protein n=1 Tax=Phytophthora pseudosyringae TaxID=221518 RepID=A0A8T1W7R7_9STRA|nr:hypothetical protein PHYPSEUDO_013688 [Phytophthora pseudosyringae]
MLSKLPKKRSVMFLETQPEPAYISARRNAILELKSVSVICMSSPGRGSKTRYVVEVFTDSLQCRATSNTNSTTSNNSRGSAEVSGNRTESRMQSPNVRIERELEEFVDVRDKLYKFCLNILDPVISGVDPGGIFFTLLGKQRTLRKVTRFLEESLAPTAQYFSKMLRCTDVGTPGPTRVLV